MAVSPRDALVQKALALTEDALAREEARIDALLCARYTGGITWVPVGSAAAVRGAIERRYRSVGWRVVYVGNWQGAAVWAFSAQDPAALQGAPHPRVSEDDV